MLVAEESSINVPAIAAAHVIKRYIAQATDELTFEVTPLCIFPLDRKGEGFREQWGDMGIYSAMVDDLKPTQTAILSFVFSVLTLI